jgi:ubiquinone/menaquinone biosynthesis C-methylase UbiE
MYANKISAKIREEEKETVLKLALPVKKLKILDVGTGTGRFALEYLVHSAQKVIGIDIAENMLVEARKKCQKFNPRCEFKLMSVYDLKFPKNSFDFVSCIGVLEHCGNEKKAIEQMSRVLKPKGKIVIATANGHSLLKNFVKWYEKKVTGLPKYFHLEDEFKKWFEANGINLEQVKFCGLFQNKHLALRLVVKGTKNLV